MMGPRGNRGGLWLLAVVGGLLGLCCGLASELPGQTPPTSSPTSAGAPATVKGPSTPPTAQAAPPVTSPATMIPTPTAPAIDTSEAARILRLKESIARTKETIDGLKAALEDPQSEYQLAKMEEERLKLELRQKQQLLEEYQKQNLASEVEKQKLAVAEVEKFLAAVTAKVQQAMQQRAAKQTTLSAMNQQLKKDQDELDRLEGRTKPEPSKPNGTESATPLPTMTPAPATKSGPAVPAVPGLPIPTGTPPAPKPEPAPEKPTDPKLIEATERVASAQKSLEAAKTNLASAQERLEAVRKSINAITALLELEQQSLAAKNLERATISRQLEEGNLSATDRVALLSRAALLDDRLRIARDRVTEHQNKLEFLQNEQRSIDQELEAAKQEKKLREQETLNAEENLKEIANPLSPRNIVRWFVNHGPNLIVIAVVTVALYLFMRTFTQQIVGLLIRAGSTVRPDERENRASTLTGVFRYIVGVFILGGGLVMLLDEAGVPIVPFMGGAAVFGLAVAFGAQNLIKDYFSGFMMLMEDQYGVNDVVRINQTAGQVEEITLRITVLRDLEGIRHFIPHGTITQVSNLTHTWSRAMFDIPVAYSTNVDQAIATLMQLANDLRKDPIHGPTIIEEPEMLGVDQFTASAVVIKFVLKTKPLKQWPVKRELLRRIKNRFDELGIEIPVNAHTIEVKGGLGWPSGEGAGLAGRAENGTMHSAEPARSPYGYS